MRLKKIVTASCFCLCLAFRPAAAEPLHPPPTGDNQHQVLPAQLQLAQSKTRPADSSARHIRQALAEKPALLLAKTWRQGMDVQGWWMSEKLDGVRAYWNGEALVSRGGKRLHAPAWFTQRLPATPLDGELWMGRGQFEPTVGIVRSHAAGDKWRKIRYFIFDAPEVPGPFEDRLAFLQTAIPKLHLSHIQLVKQRRIKDEQDFQGELEKVIAQGGEGLMLRQAGSFYVGKRSGTLLKVKPYQDAEAEVIGHQAGKGKFEGKMGALLLRLPDGTSFKIGTGFTEREREHPPAVGEIIVFKHYGYTKKGKPRFPVYLRIYQAF